MSQGLFTAASGIRANQVTIDVISNNIANVNTLAFKGSKTNFSTVFTKTVKSGTAPGSSFGGVNPEQIGTGTQISEIAVNNSQGGTQFTGRSTDLMINGEGYFVVQNPSSSAASSTSVSFTRAGNFNTDSAGNLVTTTGNKLIGTSTVNGTTGVTTDTIKVPLKLTIAKFLDSSNKVTGTVLGSESAVVGDFSAYATANSITPASTKIQNVTLSNISVGANGSITATYSNGDRLTVRNNPDLTANSTELIHVPVEGNTFAAVNTTATGTAGRVGQLSGALAGLTSDKPGVNPMLGAAFQLQMASFTNKNGLEALTNNNYVESANSGTVAYGVPGSGNRGTLLAGSLESSNVDLANEFTNLVVAQRGLEANSKMIKAQSEAMQTILNAIN
ncbi:MAG: flagellar hook-basal body complex protein [Candidatus Melainabacteria bacterium]|jgi:flagellar hook protein FlgE|nr:flagellar hook-basal body complex protein [Candidatus Melainabacteria bacterium]